MPIRKRGNSKQRAFLVANYTSGKELLLLDRKKGKLLKRFEMELPAVPVSDTYYNYVAESWCGRNSSRS